MTAEEFLVRDELFSHPLTDEEKKIYLESVIQHSDYVKAIYEYANYLLTEDEKK